MGSELTGLVEKLNRAIRSDKVQRVALSTVLAVHKQRIFTQGQDKKDEKIGTYATDPISISKKNQARQTGKTYFKGGYAEYKKAVGRNPGYVILRNTDQMYFDYGLQGQAGNYGFGFQNQFNADKSGWAEEHFDKPIFELTQKETDLYLEVLNAQISANI